MKAQMLWDKPPKDSETNNEPLDLIGILYHEKAEHNNLKCLFMTPGLELIEKQRDKRELDVLQDYTLELKFFTSEYKGTKELFERINLVYIITETPYGTILIPHFVFQG